MSGWATFRFRSAIFDVVGGSQESKVVSFTFGGFGSEYNAGIKGGGGVMDFYFLLFSLFFPRITMVVYFLQGWYPANEVPNWLDLVLGILAPRVLVLIYIYQNMGYENVWFAAHLIVMILAYFGGGRETIVRRRRRVVED